MELHYWFNFLVAAATAAAFLISTTDALECYHCRLDLCDHEYCDATMEVLNRSNQSAAAEYIGIQNWTSIRSCPHEWEASRQNFSQTCLSPGSTCGQRVFNITTKSYPNIQGSSSNSIPVVGGAIELHRSAIVVLGCVPANAECHSGLKLNSTEQRVRGGVREKEEESRAKVTQLEHVNSATACCHCGQDLCNDVSPPVSTESQTTPVECTNNIHEPEMLESSNGGGRMGASPPTSWPFLAVFAAAAAAAICQNYA